MSYTHQQIRKFIRAALNERLLLEDPRPDCSGPVAKQYRSEPLPFQMIFPYTALLTWELDGGRWSSHQLGPSEAGASDHRKKLLKNSLRVIAKRKPADYSDLPAISSGPLYDEVTEKYVQRFMEKNPKFLQKLGVSMESYILKQGIFYSRLDRFCTYEADANGNPTRSMTIHEIFKPTRDCVFIYGKLLREITRLANSSNNSVKEIQRIIGMPAEKQTGSWSDETQTALGVWLKNKSSDTTRYYIEGAKIDDILDRKIGWAKVAPKIELVNGIDARYTPDAAGLVKFLNDFDMPASIKDDADTFKKQGVSRTEREDFQKSLDAQKKSDFRQDVIDRGAAALREEYLARRRKIHFDDI